jgi:hypothetical protein
MKTSGLAAVVAACVAAAGLAIWAAPAAAADFTAPGDDAYSKLVARAEAGDTTVDFKAMRFAWLDSIARKRATDTRDTTRTMWQAVQANDAPKVRAAAEKIIAITYTDIEAHKFRRQACAVLNDTACSAHEHFVEFGLLDSIIKAGDGKTPATAWVVAEVSEEYVIMRLVGYHPGMQQLINQDGRVYDKLTTKDKDGVEHVLWFDISIAITKEIPGLS